MQAGYILFDYGTTFSELKENYQMMNKYSWTICRGIFSEMYAARGTPYTTMLHKRGLIKGDIRLGNYYYEIKDAKSKMAYKALKNWHISHMRMYNMVIEPIHKPKILSDNGLAAFYNLYQDVRKQDLDFMGKVLDIIENNESQKYLDNFVTTMIESSNKWFKTYSKKVEKLFALEEISYLAEDDPFTC